MKKPQIRWQKVTPALAKKWLDVNLNNRTLRENHITLLAADMANDRWENDNGESIKFDVKGRLIDGQHRLHACILSGKTFGTLIVEGVSEKSYDTVDIGYKKVMADFLQPNGEKNSLQLAASLKLVYYWHNGNLGKLKDGSLTPTIKNMHKLLEDEPLIRESVHFVVGHTELKRLLTPSYACLLHYSGVYRNKKNQVEVFLNGLATGVGLMADNPIYQFRKFLLGQKGPKIGTRRAGQMYVLALMLKAWGAFQSNEKVKLLKYEDREGWPEL